MPNYFTVNGKSYPETETVRMEVGERLRIRFIGSNNNFVHPMHVHWGSARPPYLWRNRANNSILTLVTRSPFPGFPVDKRFT